MAHDLEVRVPFLDRDVLDETMSSPHPHPHPHQVRVPFLDRDVLDETMSIAGEHKMVKKGAPQQYIEK